MGRDDQAWAVFWCSLLSPLLLGEVPQAEREAYFRTLAEQERLLPNGQRKRISVRTLRRWWKRLREEGVEGTFRRRRSDRGRPRTKQQQLLERAVQLKKEQPRRSDVVINRILKQEFGRGVPRSTLYRHLHRQGATRRKLGVSAAEGALPLDARPGRSVVGRRLRARTARAASGTRRGHSTFRLDRLSQPLHRGSQILRARELRRARRLAAARLDASWRQPRTLCRQRQDLSRQGAEAGLHAAEHQAAASAAARSGARRADRAVLPDAAGTAGGRDSRRQAALAGRHQPRAVSLVDARVSRRGSQRDRPAAPASATTRQRVFSERFGCRV